MRQYGALLLGLLAGVPARAEWPDTAIATAACAAKVDEALEAWEPEGCADTLLHESRRRIRRRARFALREACYLAPERHILQVGAREQQENSESAGLLLMVSSVALLPLAPFAGGVGLSAAGLSSATGAMAVGLKAYTTPDSYETARSMEPHVDTSEVPSIRGRAIRGKSSRAILEAVETLIERYQARHLRLAVAQGASLEEAENRRSVFSLGLDRVEILRIIAEQKEAHLKLYELEAKELNRLDAELVSACGLAAEDAARGRVEAATGRLAPGASAGAQGPSLSSGQGAPRGAAAGL